MCRECDDLTPKGFFTAIGIAIVMWAVIMGGAWAIIVMFATK